ncbi:hypothetical protein BKA62DRAFT_617384 [Auriculariales sp. MPI-PUGE-AT-0066]|nr:hypothetical protein BKA62DRAFT_617384 [Auriculariales sp. MPI-PUGE-AT-0066]
MRVFRRERARPQMVQSIAATLPPEILFLIFSHFQPGAGGPVYAENRQALARALRTCTSWYKFADLMYQTVQLDMPALIRFHTTVRSNEALAAMVRHLHLPLIYCLPRWYWSFPDSPFVNSNNRRHECRPQFHLALEVARLCKRLITLHFPTHGPFARLRMLPSGHLKNLRSLMLNSNDVAYFSSVLPASLVLENLLELRMQNFHFLPSHLAPKQFASMPNLCILRFWSCALDWTSLGTLVHSVSATLRFIELRLNSWPMSNVPAMFQALSSVQHSLTMLSIRGSCGAPPRVLEQHLERFSALRYLHYDELFCTRFCTPSHETLERLSLVTRFRTDAWDYIRRLAEWLRDPPKGLKELSVEVHSPRRRDVRVWKLMTFCLAARCEKHGIQLEVLLVRGVPFRGPTKCYYAVTRTTPERMLYDTVDIIGRKGLQLKSRLKAIVAMARAGRTANG